MASSKWRMANGEWPDPPSDLLFATRLPTARRIPPLRSRSQSCRRWPHPTACRRPIERAGQQLARRHGRAWRLGRDLSVCPLESADQLRRRPKTTESEPQPVMLSRLESADWHGGREHDARFSSMPRSRVGSSAACRAARFHSLLKARIPWYQGKKQGIYSIQPFFCEKPSRKHLPIQ